MNRPTPSLLEKWKVLGSIAADKSLPSSAVKVAWVVFDHHNSTTGKCYPSRETIATRLGITIRSVALALAALERGGYLLRKRRGRGHSNSYAPLAGNEGKE